jgi:hypothetical protein
MGVIVDLSANPADGFRTAFAVAGTVVILGAFAGFALIVPEADLARLAAGPEGRVAAQQGGFRG